MIAAQRTTSASKATRSRSTDSLGIYLKEISKFPLLSVQEERELCHAIQQGDEGAAKKLIESNLRFVAMFAKRYRESGLSYLDLINEGNLGLIEAAKRFDPTRNVRFISYAVWWVRDSIVRALSEFRRPFRLPVKLDATLYKIGANLANRTSGIEDPPTRMELAVEIGATQAEQRWILEGGGEGISLQEPLTKEGETTLEEFLVQTRVPSPDEEVVRRSMEKSLDRLLEQLGEREREILRLRYGLDDDTPLHLEQIAKKFGLSRERVRQIIVGTLKKLRKQRHTHSFMNEASLFMMILDSRRPSY